MDLSGSGQAINLGNPSSAWNITGALTISAWVYVDVDDGGRMVSRQGFGGGRGYQLSTEADGNAYITISGDGSNGFSAFAALTVGQWQHWVGVYLPSTYVRVYRNGEQAAENTTGIPASQFNNNENLQIGRRPTEDLYFNGKLADVCIWNRALSPGEIRGLFRFGPASYKPLGWYPLHGVGNFVQDWSGNKYNGTLVGTPTAFNNPPKRPFSSRLWNASAPLIEAAGGGGGGISIPVAMNYYKRRRAA